MAKREAAPVDPPITAWLDPPTPEEHDRLCAKYAPYSWPEPPRGEDLRIVREYLRNAPSDAGAAALIEGAARKKSAQRALLLLMSTAAAPRVETTDDVYKLAMAHPEREGSLIDAVCDGAQEGKAKRTKNRQEWVRGYFGPAGVIANAIAERRNVEPSDLPKPWSKALAPRYGVCGKTISNELRRHFLSALTNAERDHCRRVGVFKKVPTRS